MMFAKGDRLTWQGRTGTVLTTTDNRFNGHGYVRLLLDDVHLPYWVEYNYLAYAGRPGKPSVRIRTNVRTEAA